MNAAVYDSLAFVINAIYRSFETITLPEIQYFDIFDPPSFTGSWLRQYATIIFVVCILLREAQ
jgi:hypothetical protein